MPKPANISNPIAAIRCALGLKMESFAEHVGHSAAVLKHIESGRRPLTDEVADKIHIKTGVPYRVLWQKEVTEEDRIEIEISLERATAPIDDADFGARAMALLPDILALYVLMARDGRDPRLALRPIKREIQRTIERWKIDSADFENARTELWRCVFAPFRGIDPAFSPCDLLLATLEKSKGAAIVEKAKLAWSRKNPPSAEFLAEMKPLMDSRARKKQAAPVVPVRFIEESPR